MGRRAGEYGWGMATDPDDDLRRAMREFRESTAEEFARIDERFRRVDARFDRLEGRMDDLEGRLGGLEGRVGGLEGRFADFQDEVRARFHTTETAILNTIGDLSADMHRQFALLTQAGGNHDARLRRPEE